MSRIDKSLGRPLQGVSQQDESLRPQGQCNEQINMLPDPVYGVVRRPGTRLARLSEPFDDYIKFIDRSGEKPMIIETTDDRATASDIVRWVAALKQEGRRSIAIICKTAKDAFNLHQTIGADCEATLVTKDDHSFTRGVVVIPSYLAKGLEFDAVVIHDVSKRRYADERERKLLYTACTRALHRLILYCVGEPSPLIAAVPADLYILAQASAVR